MSRTYNKHHKGYYGNKTDYKKYSDMKRRVQEKELINDMMKVPDEEKEDVEYRSQFNATEGMGWYCYD